MNLLYARLAPLICLLCLTCVLPTVAGEPTTPQPSTEQAEPPKSKMETGIIGILIFLSVISLGLIAERGMALRHETVIPQSLAKTAIHCHKPEELLALRAACNERPSPHGRLLIASIEHLDLPREENAELLQTRANAVWWFWRSSPASDRCLDWSVHFLGLSHSFREWVSKGPRSKLPYLHKASASHSTPHCSDSW
ncbi:hypothetical protein OAL58_08260 [Verrucomicrobia bacterium]|nr:hypothetical protein [Verrucomicrobiota bacterium]